MEDLNDHLLTQILFRLPSAATALACTPVNKRWCSLISDPNFPDQFVDHKKKTTALLKASGSDHEDDDEPPWSFIISMRNSKNRSIITKFIFGLPKLSLEFLLCHTLIIAKATFKDLVLFLDNRTRPGTGLVYYITNPLTKQWVALPPTPWVNYRSQWETTTVLICQPPYNHTQHYKFRVVEFRYPINCLGYVDNFKLAVYCSEIGEWKEINLRMFDKVGPTEPEIVVCNGIIYFTNGLSLMALNPFDVRVMPPLPDFGYLQESCGQLILLHTSKGSGIPYLAYEEDGTTTVELEMVVSKLDLNKAPLVWEKTFQGLCKGTVSTDSPYWPRIEQFIQAADIGVHPYNDKLIYLRLDLDKHQLVLCDTRTRCITPSKRLPRHYVLGFHRLEHQWWPTSVPVLVNANHG